MGRKQGTDDVGMLDALLKGTANGCSVGGPELEIEHKRPLPPLSGLRLVMRQVIPVLLSKYVVMSGKPAAFGITLMGMGWAG